MPGTKFWGRVFIGWSYPLQAHRKFLAFGIKGTGGVQIDRDGVRTLPRNCTGVVHLL